MDPVSEFVNMTSDAYTQPSADESEIAKMSRGVATFIAVLFIGYMVLGLTGNFLTILALLRCPRVRNVTAAFIISLCVADFLFCVLVLPWEVSRFLAGRWIWGEGWICTLFPLLRYWNVAVSLLSIAMITINRYIMIAHFSVYKSVYRKGWIALMIAFCWVFAFVMLVPTLLRKWGRFGFDPRLQTCSILDNEHSSPKQVLFGLGFCVPAIVIVICYSLIFFVIHKSEMRMRHHSTRGMNGAHTGSSLQSQVRGTGKMEREARRRRNEWRITKMVLIIFIAFLITYLPITLVKNLDKKVNYPGLHVLGYVLIYISSCINPVIYVIMNRQYRQAYKTVLLCKRPRLPSLTSSHSEAPKGSTNRRFASSRWSSSCMSQGSFGDSSLSHGRRPYSMHGEASLRRKCLFPFKLRGFVTPETQSVEMASLEASSRRSRLSVGATVLPLPSSVGGVKSRSTGDLEAELNSKAFLNHLLDVETTSSYCSSSPSSSKVSSKRSYSEDGLASPKGSSSKVEEELRRVEKKKEAEGDADSSLEEDHHSPDSSSSRERTPSPSDKGGDPQSSPEALECASTSDTRSVGSNISREQTSSSRRPSVEEDVPEEPTIRAKPSSESCDLLHAVSQSIYDKHASWAPWLPGLYPTVHDGSQDTKLHDESDVHDTEGEKGDLHDSSELHEGFDNKGYEE